MARIKIEDINERLVDRVQEVYFNAEIQMLDRVKKRVERNIKFEGYNEKKLKEIQELRNEIATISDKSNNIVKRDINDGFVDVYKAGRENVSSLPDNILRDKIPYKLQRHMLAMDDILNGTSKHMIRNVDDIYRDITNQSVSGVLVGTDTLQQAAQKSLNQYAANGITGFIDKAGRKWDLQSYASMATRTVANNVAKQGHIDRSVEMGRDLMIVSAHNSTCPVCAPWSNKILSISGNNAKYPSLSEAEASGLFHPNCKHTLLAYDEEDAELDQLLGIEHGEEGYDALNDTNDEMYAATQKQRYNERQIRKWKKYEAVSLDNTQAAVSQHNIAEYQSRNRSLVNKYGLKRNYAREGNMVGQAGQAIKYKDYPKLEEQVELLDVSDKTKNFIYNSNNRTLVSPSGTFDTFEEALIDFTAGGSTVPEDTLAILENNKAQIAKLSPLDRKISETIIDIVEKAPKLNQTIYRIEEEGLNKALKMEKGSTFTSGLRSYSRSESWINASLSGDLDVVTDNPIVYRLKNAKSINLRPYSPYFAEQEESATMGIFKVLGINKRKINGLDVKFIDIEQIAIRKKALVVSTKAPAVVSNKLGKILQTPNIAFESMSIPQLKGVAKELGKKYYIQSGMFKTQEEANKALEALLSQKRSKTSLLKDIKSMKRKLK